ncbi:hypothetical protein ACLMJK_006598 [Lecanora helva]
MPPKPKLNVHSFPRPPLLEKTPRHLQIKWHNQIIADTKDAYWVLETTHPPTYYLPPTSIHLPLYPSPHTSFCEWKGRATYYNLSLPNPPNSSPSPSPSTIITNRAWSYDTPTKAYEAIKGYVSFYAGPWDCYVDGEKVEPQPGDFYGGWVTGDIEGRVKGGSGTWGW